MRTLLFCLVFLLAKNSSGQDTLSPILSAEGFLAIVKKYHPVVKQADIEIDIAKARQLAARGAFDPTIEAVNSAKNFDGVKYYNATEPVLTIPTWYGIDLKAGTALWEGDRLNPSETAGKTNFVGISVPLAKNLLMDKRRAALKTAAIYRSLSAVEKRTVINELLLEASIAYWEWVSSYELLKIASEAVAVNEERLRLVTNTVAIGERAAVDTVETLAQLQTFRYQQNDASNYFLNSTLNLGIFLWKENAEPYELPAGISPATGQLENAQSVLKNKLLVDFIDSAIQQHPKLKEFDEKLKALEVSRRLAFQELLPTINLKYNQLGKGYDLAKTTGMFLSENNYRFGLSLALPLRLSKGRGEFKVAKLKINDMTLERGLTRQLIINKVTSSFNELQNTSKQIAVQEEIYKNYLRLQQAEETRYFNGESSLFLINSRETKAIEAKQKLLQIKAKLFIAEAKLKNAAGLF